MTSEQTELGRFLRTRRAGVRPADVGLPAGTGTRRTPGLRREELATLAGVSIDYYTRLERGKETRPSPAVVDALARALLLDDEEHEFFRALAAQAARRAPVPPPPPSRLVRPTVRHLLETLRPNPAYVLSRTNDLLAANPAGLQLLPGLAGFAESTPEPSPLDPGLSPRLFHFRIIQRRRGWPGEYWPAARRSGPAAGPDGPHWSEAPPRGRAPGRSAPRYR